jgi:hypothetical protein
MPFRVVPIVEGHGEVQAVPELVRRLIAEFNPAVAIELARAIRRPRGTLLKEGGLEDAVRLGALEIGDHGAILVLLDSEGDCPAELAPPLLARARKARPDKQVSLVLAHQEFEAWFLAAASTLGLGSDVQDHAAPENIRDCKGWLQTHALIWRYSPSVDQVKLAAVFDFRRARRAPSFDKFYREVEEICRHASLPAPY